MPLRTAEELLPAKHFISALKHVRTPAGEPAMLFQLTSESAPLVTECISFHILGADLYPGAILAFHNRILVPVEDEVLIPEEHTVFGVALWRIRPGQKPFSRLEEGGPLGTFPAFWKAHVSNSTGRGRLDAWLVRAGVVRDLLSGNPAGMACTLTEVEFPLALFEVIRVLQNRTAEILPLVPKTEKDLARALAAVMDTPCPLPKVLTLAIREMLISVSAWEPPQNSDDTGSTEAGAAAAPTGQVELPATGMAWTEARHRAEAEVKRSGWPGANKLATKVGCSKPTIKKAIDASVYLSARKAEAEAADGRSVAGAASVADFDADSRAADPSVGASLANDDLVKRLLDAATPAEKQDLLAMPRERLVDLADMIAQDPGSLPTIDKPRRSRPVAGGEPPQNPRENSR